MKYLFWLFFVPLIVFGQSNTIKGTITEGVDSTASINTFIKIEQLNLTTKTDSTGSFLFKDIPDGDYIIIIGKNGFMSQHSNPILVANNTIYNLTFHLDTLDFPISLGPPSIKYYTFYTDDFSRNYFSGGDSELIEFGFDNTLNHLINRNTNITMIYQKYSDGLFLYNGIALENNIYIDETKISGINPQLFTHLINTNLLSSIEIDGIYGSDPGLYPQTKEIFLQSEERDKVNFFASNKNFTSIVSINRIISSNLFDVIRYHFSYSKSVNNYNQNKESNVDFPNADINNIYCVAEFEVNPSQKFHISYFFLDSDFNVNNSANSDQNFLYNHPQNINLNSINFNSSTTINRDQFIDFNFTYNKSNERKSNYYVESNNSTTILTSYINFNADISSDIYFRIGYQHNYYITDFSNIRNFDRDHSLIMTAFLNFNKLSIDPFFSLLYYDKDKYLSLPGVNIAYSIFKNSKIIVNYSVGYNRRNVENSIEYGYEGIYNWRTFSKYRPELYKNFSITFKYVGFDLFGILVSAYHIKYENIAKRELKANTTSMIYELTGYENITTNGSTINLNICPIEEFTFSINYTLQDIKDSQSKDLRLRPNHSGFATLQYQSYHLKLNAAIELRYYGNKYAPVQYSEYSNFNVYDVAEYKTSDALITNVFIEKKLSSQFAFTIGAYNIFDRKTENYCSYQSIEYFLKMDYRL